MSTTTTSPSAPFAIRPEGPFSLDALRTLACGFLRGTRKVACPTAAASDSAAEDLTVKIAFPRDEDFAIAGASLRLRGGVLEGRAFGAGARDPDAVARQVARTLGLDHDGERFAALLERDPVLRPISRRRRGFRPVVAYSPWVMAGWAVLSQRIRMDQAAALQVKLSAACGDTLEIDGDVVAAFPRPASLLSLGGFPGIPEAKWARLRALALAAFDGALDPARLSALPYADARASLEAIHGVGPWTADAVLVRGTGATDLLPLGERTLHGAVKLAYGLSTVPDDATVARIAESWRPFRTWVTVLLVSEHFEAARAIVRERRLGGGISGGSRASAPSGSRRTPRRSSR